MVAVPNHRLRNALTAAEITQSTLAERIEVDPKSVERWITQDRVPHANTRARVARLLAQDETYFWPQLLDTSETKNATEAELVQIWPTRSVVPADVWRTLLRQTHSQLDVLVYSGGFLVESFDLVDVIGAKAAAGTHIRILLGDPQAENVRSRGREEGLPTLPQRCTSTAEYLAEVAHLDGVSIRIHQTVLYASQFRFDDAMLINPHTYGSYAARSPVHHLKRVPGGQLFTYYDQAFERVWATGKPLA